MPTPFSDNDLYVSITQGNDEFSGTCAEPCADGSDGPVKTLVRAQHLVRERIHSGRLQTRMTVWVREGRYTCRRPLRFGPQDSGAVTWAAYPGETPVLDGSVPVHGWEETDAGGVTAWVADISWLLQHTGEVRTLFANDRACPRTRVPEQGFLHIADVPEEFMRCATEDPLFVPMFSGTPAWRFHEGDIRQWHNMEDVEIVALHAWLEERMPVKRVDMESRTVFSTRHSAMTLNTDDRYYIENVFEALKKPGQWYCDRTAGRLYYVPQPGQTPENTEIRVGYATQLLRIEGEPSDNRIVSGLVFDGLHFARTTWHQPDGWGRRYDPEVPYAQRGAQDSMKHFLRFTDTTTAYAAAIQGAINVPGVLLLRGAHNCTIRNCHISDVGWYAVQMLEGCMSNSVQATTMHDLGAGGIMIDGGDTDAAPSLRSGHNAVADNHIYNGGTVFHSACGILLANTFGNAVVHNRIHDLIYTGISCGWVWGYAPHIARDNMIEKNHIYGLGKGILSDFGGIYTLGVQPGTTVRGNLIHDLEKCDYGSWCIYPDEGSSHIVFENNIAYNSNSQPFHIHFGRENIVRNNIFAFGSEGQIAISRGRRHAPSGMRAWGCSGMMRAFTFVRNIVLTDGRPVYLCATVDDTGCCEENNFESDCNVFWDISGHEIFFGNGRHGACTPERMRAVYSLAQMQRMGYDRHSIIADPGCADPRRGDFTLGEDSPAISMGFTPIDMSDVGPRE